LCGFHFSAWIPKGDGIPLSWRKDWANELLGKFLLRMLRSLGVAGALGVVADPNVAFFPHCFSATWTIWAKHELSAQRVFLFKRSFSSILGNPISGSRQGRVLEIKEAFERLNPRP